MSPDDLKRDMSDRLIALRAVLEGAVGYNIMDPDVAIVTGAGHAVQISTTTPNWVIYGRLHLAVIVVRSMLEKLDGCEVTPDILKTSEPKERELRRVVCRE